ncbi:MAG: S-layer homology domain-containing protein, partial [Acidimicrobiia bacterium]
PYEYLLVAPRVDGAAPPRSPAQNQFRDVNDSVHRNNIEILFAEGITKGCNPPINDMYCPREELTRGQVAAFLRRNLALPASEQDFFTDDSASVFEDDINALTAAGIGFGCTETTFCPDVPLTRAEMAEYLVRTYGFENSEGTDFFTDDGTSPHQDAINALFANDITVGCSDEAPLYCPDDSLTREQMATFLARSLGLGT